MQWRVWQTVVIVAGVLMLPLLAVVGLIAAIVHGLGRMVNHA